MKKYNVFAGNYGSGKTEISINTALSLTGKRILLDMDIVNPYFRSSEHEKMLNEAGVELIKPCFANTMVDVPSLSAEIYRPFGGGYDTVIFDAGGDPVGATALGSLKDKFESVQDELSFYYVINANRPLQETPEDIVDMLRTIEKVSKLKVCALISNSNLANVTTAQTVIEGHQVVRKVSEITGIPVEYVAAKQELMEDVKKAIRDCKYIPLRIFTRPEWLDEQF